MNRKRGPGVLQELGYEVAAGPDLAAESRSASATRQVVLAERLAAGLNQLNPELPRAVIENSTSSTASDRRFDRLQFRGF